MVNTGFAILAAGYEILLILKDYMTFGAWCFTKCSLLE